MGMQMEKLCTALALTFAIVLSSSVSAQQPVKIGFVGTFSGPGASFGEDMYDGFMLPIENNGGKLGGVPVEVIRKDSQSNPNRAAEVTAVQTRSRQPSNRRTSRS